MTNNTIITNAAISSGIISAEDAAQYIKAGKLLPIHTYAEWRSMGYQVKTGEHAALAVALWTQFKDKHGEDNRMIRSMAYLFTAAQVERRQAVHIKTAEEIRQYNAMLAAQRRKKEA